MNRITLLPHWQLPDSIPSVYDTQSGSYQEMVAKVYGAMRTLQTEYNSFVDEINKTITEFIESTNEDQECFKNKIIKIMHDYIIKIDEKIKMQDLVIDNAIKYMKDNLVNSINKLLDELQEMGELDELILNSFNNLNDKFNSLDKRIINLETAEKPYITYDNKSESLIFYNIGGVTNE